MATISRAPHGRLDPDHILPARKALGYSKLMSPL
jgi:hypothetical protein